MRASWKLVGLAGLAGVAATGVALARKRRAQHDYDPDELRRHLHRRLADVPAHGAGAGPGAQPGDPPVPGWDEGRAQRSRLRRILRRRAPST
jgi:hypothetical protein